MIAEFGTPLWTRIYHIIFGGTSGSEILKWAIGVLLAALVAVATVMGSLLIPIALAGLIIAGPFVLSALWNVKIGLYIMGGFAYFLSVFNRLLPSIPIGIALDAMILLMLSGLCYRCYKKNDWSSFKSPISGAIGLWAAMNVAELANPIAESRVAWIYVIRPAVGYLMLFFLVISTLKTRKEILGFLFYLIFLNTISAFWGIYQYHFGYFDWEMEHIIRHDAIHLVFNDGRWRSIGSIGSPAQFGMLMAFMGTLGFFMMGGAKCWFVRLLLLIASGSAILALLYSGTRSAFVIPAVMYFVWVFISGKKRWYLSLLVAMGLLIALANIKTSNYQIQRIQTLFNATQDNSYKVRAQNRAHITPWIISHPMGGGLGSTGVWGMRFSPHTFLAHFPPDSGIIRVAVELGWIGLIFFLSVYGHIIIKGWLGFRRMKDRLPRMAVAAIVCGMCSFLLVEWGQEVMGVYPISLLYWCLSAIMIQLMALEPKKTIEQ